MAKHVIEYDCKCSSCDGSGLYVGFAEKCGFAVVCHDCNGSGKQHVEYKYEDFDGRVDKKGIKRVIQVNPGIGIGLGKTKCGPIKVLTETSFGGMSYKDWKAGKKFGKGTEMRNFTCPAWWYQTADYSQKPNWNECIGCGSFSGCPNFSSKEKCWEKFDKQGPK